MPEAISRIRICAPQLACLIRVAAMLGVLGAVLISVATAAVPTPAAPAADSFLQSLTEEERAWLRDHPVIRVAQDPSWPPIEFARQGGEPSGMTRDYLSLIEQRLGLKFEPVLNLSWQEAYARMKRWEVDMTTTVATTTERESFWAFTKPYMTIPIVVVTRSDVTYIGDLGELEGRKVVVVDGYVSNDWISRDFPGIQLVRVNTTQEALAMLERGEVFACVENMLVVSHYLAELRLTGLKISGSTPYVNAQRMAVRKDWAPLAGILDKALDSISQAERNAIYRKWLPIRYEVVDYWRFWPWAALLVMALLFPFARHWSRAHESRANLPGGWQVRPWQAYLFAILVTVATFGLRFALDSRLGGQPTLVIFTLPIMLSAYVGGLRAGLLATAITFFGASYYLLPPLDSFAIASSIQRWQQFFLLLTGISISGLSEALHRSRLRAALALESRTRAEAANERSLQRLTEAQRVGQIGDWDFEIATGAITWSPQTFEILGRDPSLGPPRNYEENAALYEPESAALMSEKVAQAIASGEAQEYELVALRPDGSRVQLQARAVPMADESGNFSSLHGTVQNISASKRAKAALRESEGRYRTLFERAPDGIVIVDSGGRYVDVNAAICQMLGYTREEMIGRHASTVVLPEEVPHIQEAFDELGTGTDYHREWQFRRKDGSVFSADAVAAQMPDGTALGILRDITERRRAEAALRESEEKFRAVADQSLQGFVLSQDGVTTYVNQAFCDTIGYSREEALAMTPAQRFAMVHADNSARVLDRKQRYERGEPIEQAEEIRITRKDGAVRWVLSSNNSFPLQGKPARLGIFLDITERKEAEAERAQLLHVLEASLNEIYIFDTQTLRFQYANDCARRNLGYSTEAMSALTPVDLKPEFSEASFNEEIGPLRRHEKEKLLFETVHRRADGSLYPVEVHLQLVEREGGAVFLAVISDITARKQAEAELTASERRLRQVVDGLGAHMFVGLLDTAGIMQVINKPARDVAGLSDENIVGRPFADAYWWAHSTKVQKRLQDAIQRAAGGESIRYDEQIRVAEDQLMWIDFSLQPLRSESGDVTALVPSASVIDERKQAEQKLRYAMTQQQRLARRLVEVQEAEQRQLSAELHDRIGQNLTALSINLKIIGSSGVQQNTAAAVRLQDSQELLKITIGSVRDLLSELRPPALEDYGLLAGLRWHADRLQQRTGLVVSVSGEEPSPRLGGPVENALFRIAQEALTNVVKHARAATASVVLGQQAGVITLEISDDGQGLERPIGRRPDDQQGWGLEMMRERAQAVGAELHLHSTPGLGTQLTISVPPDDEHPACR